jgi:hypothetical protein
VHKNKLWPLSSSIHQFEIFNLLAQGLRSSGLLGRSPPTFWGEHIASIFRVTCLWLVSWFVYSLTLKMEATRSSEISVYFYRIIRPYNPEDYTLRSH